MNYYDRINITIYNHNLTARPIKFQYNGDEIVGVSRYETTCPHCGNSVEFDIGTNPVCGCSEPATKKDSISVISQKMAVKVFTSDDIVEVKPRKSVRTGCPFLDPVESGAFVI